MQFDLVMVDFELFTYACCLLCSNAGSGQPDLQVQEHCRSAIALAICASSTSSSRTLPGAIKWPCLSVSSRTTR